jgi:hypothetical protein
MSNVQTNSMMSRLGCTFYPYRGALKDLHRLSLPISAPAPPFSSHPSLGLNMHRCLVRHRELRRSTFFLVQSTPRLHNEYA